VALLGVLFGFKETNVNYHISKLKIPFIANKYLILLRSPIFVGIILGTSLNYGVFFAWFVIGPVLLIDKLGISPMEFGWITFLCGGISYCLAGFLNSKLVKICGIPTMLRVGWGIMLLSGIAMMAGYYFFGINIWSIMIPVILLFFGSTFIWPNAIATAFTPFGDIAGYAGALYGCIQVSGAASFAAFVSFLPDENQLTLAIAITITSIVSWLIYELVVYKNLNQQS
jgi:DHA1 family bicyclomycin/chloramphenicol resistance-like MFS transporter/DHA1 family 2-module integral membrane pump EmrD-like MFS transporter